MKNLTKIAKNWGYTALLLSLATLASCSKSDDGAAAPTTPEPEPTPEITLNELIGVWEAEGYTWDLDNGKSACYLMNEDGTDYAYDENDNYITCTIREYCEQYTKDYNADPKNEIKGTPYDFADHSYEDTYMYTNINITQERIVIYTGQYIPGVTMMKILCVSGAYTYDPATGVMTVDDQANQLELRTLKIDISKDSEGRMNFRYSDFDNYTTPNYAQTQSWYVYAPMIFYCRPGQPLPGE